MDVKVEVSEVTLDTIVRDFGEDGHVTLGDKVASKIVQRLVAERDYWGSLEQRYRDIRDEEIREAVRPQIAEALSRPTRRTNSFGEEIGEATTLTDIIVAEARKMLTTKTDSYRSTQTVMQKIVADAVHEALGKEIAEQVKAARAMVADQIGQQVAAAVQAGMKAR